MHPANVKPHTQAVNCERVKELWPGTHCLCMCGYSTSLVDYYMPGCCLQNRFKMLAYFRVMEIVIIITTHADNMHNIQDASLSKLVCVHDLITIMRFMCHY